MRNKITWVNCRVVERGGDTIICYGVLLYYPDSKVHGASMGPIWGRQDPGGPHVGPMNLAIWVLTSDASINAIGLIKITWLYHTHSIVKLRDVVRFRSSTRLYLDR